MTCPTPTPASERLLRGIRETVVGRLKLVAAALISFLAAFMNASAEPSSAARVQAFARLPSWSGIWESTTRAQHDHLAGRDPGGEAQLRRKLQLIRHPPYSARWEAKYEAAMKSVAATVEVAAARKSCSRAFPGLMESPFVFQAVVLPEETLLIFENGQVRHIYTDGRRHPGGDDLWPTTLGDSIGRWEGATLLIDTVALTPGPIDPRAPFSTLSAGAHFTERLRRLDHDQLEDDLTIEDPIALARPWRITLRFRRVTDLDRLMPYDCTENDRNPIVNGKITIAAPR